jgi:hypothetical protein
MRMARIKFTNDKDDARGFVELAKRVRVICLPDDEYEISEKALSILDELDIPYFLLEIEGFDHVYGKIRNFTAAKV